MPVQASPHLPLSPAEPAVTPFARRLCLDPCSQKLLGSEHGAQKVASQAPSSLIWDRFSSPDWSFPFSQLPPRERVTQRCSSCIPLNSQAPWALLSSSPVLLPTTLQERGCNNRRHGIRRAKEIVVAKIASQLMNAARPNCVWRKERCLINLGGCRGEGILLMKINRYLYKREVHNYAFV